MGRFFLTLQCFSDPYPLSTIVQVPMSRVMCDGSAPMSHRAVGIANIFFPVTLIIFLLGVIQSTLSSYLNPKSRPSSLLPYCSLPFN